MINSNSTEDPPTALRHLIWGFISSQIVGAIAAFSIPDLIRSGARTAKALAEALGVPEDRVFRLLRAACSLNLLVALDEDQYALAPMGELLCKNTPRSQREQAIAYTDAWQWVPWSRFREGILTGQPPIGLAFEADLFAYLAAHPDQERRFNSAMAGSTDLLVKSLIAKFDLSPYMHIVDVGGGTGRLCEQILGAFPHIKATVFDRDNLASMFDTLHGNPENDRLCFVSGDFFDKISLNADLFILKAVLHDWSDAQALTILNNCRKAMGSDSRVAIVEQVMPSKVELVDVDAARSDLDMFVINGGAERTIEEYSALLYKAGLQIDEVVAIRGNWKVIVGSHRLEARSANGGML